MEIPLITASPETDVDMHSATDREQVSERPSDNENLTDRDSDTLPKKKAKSSKLGIRATVEKHLERRDGSELWQVIVPSQRPRSSHNARKSKLPACIDEQPGESDWEQLMEDKLVS